MKSTINELATLSEAAAYNPTVKKQFLGAARRYLAELAKELGLDKVNFDLRTNQAGIAASGDVTLHHDRIYVTFGASMGGMCGLARSCNGRKYYTGGGNIPIAPHTTNESLVARCRDLLRR